MQQFGIAGAVGCFGIGWEILIQRLQFARKRRAVEGGTHPRFINLSIGDACQGIGETALCLRPEGFRGKPGTNPQLLQLVPVPAYAAFRGRAGLSFCGAKKPETAVDTAFSAAS